MIFKIYFVLLPLMQRRLYYELKRRSIMKIYDKKDFYQKFGHQWSEKVIKAGFRAVVISNVTVFLFKRKINKNGVINKLSYYIYEPPVELYLKQGKDFRKRTIKHLKF
jgi:hypothetical protein